MNDSAVPRRSTRLRVLGDAGSGGLSLASFLGAARASEQFQAQLESLLQRLGLHRLGSDSRSIAFTGVDSGIGTTAVSVGVGWILASRHRKPSVIVGADLRPIAVSDGGEGQVGVRQVLDGTVPLKEAIQRSEFAELDVLPAGLGDSGFAGADLEQLLRTLEGDYRAVLIDTAPVLDYPETALLTTAAHGTVLVARHLATSRSRLTRAGSLIRGSGGSLQGVVMNGIEEPLPAWMAGRI